MLVKNITKVLLRFSYHDEKEQPVKIKLEGSLAIDESNLVYNKKFSFNKYKNIEKYENESLTGRYGNTLVPLYWWLKEFEKITTWAAKTKTKKEIVYNNATKLFNILLSIYFNDCCNTTNKGKEEIGEKYNPNNLLIECF